MNIVEARKYQTALKRIAELEAERDGYWIRQYDTERSFAETARQERNALQSKLDKIAVKCRRWQKQIDDGYDPSNPLVQAARDETLQMAINTLKNILEDKE